MPTPRTLSWPTPAAASTSRMPAATWVATVFACGRAEDSGSSTVARHRIARSNSSARTPVSPTSIPMTWPYPGSTRSSTRGRPPSDSTSPASTTSRSSTSSAVTLLTVAALSPVTWLSSRRLSGAWKNSVDSSVDRLRRRMSGAVVLVGSMRFHLLCGVPEIVRCR